MHIKSVEYSKIRELVSDHGPKGLKKYTVNFINTWGGPELYLQYKKDLFGLFALADLLKFNEKQRNDLISEYIFILFDCKEEVDYHWTNWRT